MRNPLGVGPVVQSLIAASIFAAPEDHGLTLDEVFELGAGLDLKDGELRDALNTATWGIEPCPGGRYGLSDSVSMMLSIFFGQPTTDDPRNLDAFDFVWCQFRELDREAGAGKGCVEKDVLLLRGESNDLDGRDLRIAVAVYILNGNIKQDGTTLSSGKPSGWGQGPKEQAAQNRGPGVTPFKGFADYIGTVADIISRRTDGRAPSPEPIRAYPDALENLGLHGLVPWWRAVAAELRKADPQTSPTTVIVLSAALAEGALCSLLERAKTKKTSMAKTELWNRPQKQWTFVELVKQAKSGSDPVFDDDLGRRAARLNDLRQRIHAGRFSAQPGSRFDLRPEEARESKETLDRVLRAALDWLARPA